MSESTILIEGTIISTNRHLLCFGSAASSVQNIDMCHCKIISPTMKDHHNVSCYLVVV